MRVPETPPFGNPGGVLVGGPANLDLCRRPWAESAVAVAVELLPGCPQRLGNEAAKPAPCRIGKPALRGLRTLPPARGTVARAADTRAARPQSAKSALLSSPSQSERNGRANLLLVDRTAYAVVLRSSETLSPAHAGLFSPLDFLCRERYLPHPSHESQLMSRLAIAITIPVAHPAKHKNSRRSLRRKAILAPTLASPCWIHPDTR
jgi:hypothetical protein